jgi:hypothetical protein
MLHAGNPRRKNGSGRTITIDVWAAPLDRGQMWHSWEQRGNKKHALEKHALVPSGTVWDKLTTYESMTYENRGLSQGVLSSSKRCWEDCEITGMGCKGSSVRITPSRPVKTRLSRLAPAKPFVFLPLWDTSRDTVMNLIEEVATNAERGSIESVDGTLLACRRACA